MRNRNCILEDPGLLRKFCKAMDKTYGCRRAFGASRDAYGECKACPLATAEKAMWLMRHKGMTMGDAVKSTLRESIAHDEAKEILAEASAAEKEPYPYLKPEEERAAAAVILGEARDEEDD